MQQFERRVADQAHVADGLARDGSAGESSTLEEDNAHSDLCARVDARVDSHVEAVAARVEALFDEVHKFAQAGLGRLEAQVGALASIREEIREMQAQLVEVRFNADLSTRSAHSSELQGAEASEKEASAGGEDSQSPSVQADGQRVAVLVVCFETRAARLHREGAGVWQQEVLTLVACTLEAAQVDLQDSSNENSWNSLIVEAQAEAKDILLLGTRFQREASRAGTRPNSRARRLPSRRRARAKTQSSTTQLFMTRG